MPKRIPRYLKNRWAERNAAATRKRPIVDGDLFEVEGEAIHRTATATTRNGNGPDDVHTSQMPNYQPEKFWTLANLRFGILQTVITAFVAVAFAYTSNALTQQATAARLDNLEKTVEERKRSRDIEIGAIKSDIKTDVVTKEILDLKLKPILDAQAAQLAILNEIRTVQIRESSGR